MKAWARDEGVRWVAYLAWCLFAVGLGLLAGGLVGGAQAGGLR